MIEHGAAALYGLRYDLARQGVKNQSVSEVYGFVTVLNWRMSWVHWIKQGNVNG